MSTDILKDFTDKDIFNTILSEGRFELDRYLLIDHVKHQINKYDPPYKIYCITKMLYANSREVVTKKALWAEAWTTETANTSANHHRHFMGRVLKIGWKV